ncbi:DUF938 domain-containing protein [Acaryochloris sp. IP29b_bin.137]|uniref:DUF938 domain-containing protein n=1 Tax=Acaryochloris sp. IP29b_bin.137 TaxID=2969217 RepID=UPI00261303A2|nr:DUF938 domain-containing protein [Acaryochloris sp. IP29b_bin.137]
MSEQDQRQYAPAVQRNRHPILAVLKQALPQHGLVLEIASGTGEHAAFFAQQFPSLVWLPSDQSQDQLHSIAAWQHQACADNLCPPIAIDVLQQDWPETVIKALAQSSRVNSELVAIININMIHIAPWSATEGLIAGAAQLLPPKGLLYFYGPFIQAEQPTVPSNQSFDRSLRHRNPEWGIRQLDDVNQVAAQNGLHLEKIVNMPANNLSVLWQKRHNVHPSSAGKGLGSSLDI